MNSFKAQCNLESYWLSHIHIVQVYLIITMSGYNISMYQFLDFFRLKSVTLSEVPLGHGFTAAGFLHPNEVGAKTQLDANRKFGRFWSDSIGLQV